MVRVDGTATDGFDTGLFEASRSRLASLAYRMLGSAADAEDAVQDAYLRWQAADRRRIETPEAWLTRVVVNLCRDRLRAAHTRRERTVGTWLPEPLLDGDPMLDPADTVEQRESVSLAVLTVMERLSPVERAVYLLRETFSYGHAEIAGILGITESASQQHLHRARRRISAVRRRGGEVDPESARRIAEEFFLAASSGRTERLVALLTDDATAISDGAGMTDRMWRYDTPQRIAGVARAGFATSRVKRRLTGGTPSVHSAVVNGGPAILFAVEDRVFGTVTFDLDGGRIALVRGIAAPVRLTRLADAWRGDEPGPPLLARW
ncbi:sigma-70 family RNA polymerase sigma factor [Streptomyces sp. MAR4 CNX-425]|uniref:sigma-70 family RNA polymerase sigma factor n=1 Tax=Streptomyces sp. MAR4 CNX-425 TaxID=3406343 RepID=UPI003B513B20